MIRSPPKQKVESPLKHAAYKSVKLDWTFEWIQFWYLSGRFCMLMVFCDVDARRLCWKVKVIFKSYWSQNGRICHTSNIRHQHRCSLLNSFCVSLENGYLNHKLQFIRTYIRSIIEGNRMKYVPINHNHQYQFTFHSRTYYMSHNYDRLTKKPAKKKFP